jgi:hypothetical protein
LLSKRSRKIGIWQIFSEAAVRRKRKFFPKAEINRQPFFLIRERNRQKNKAAAA